MVGLTPLPLALLLLAARSAPGPCDSGRPHLVLSTPQGAIVAELFEAAAPRTVGGLAGLVEARRSAPSAGSGPSKAGGPGPLVFDYTQPHVEIYTARLDASTSFESELDAEALGLHEDRIRDPGRAMDVLQRELIPAFNKVKKGGRLDPRLAAWMGRWRETSDPAFLVGASRKEVNEALGYVYTRGLDSKPVTKGSITLQPESPARAKARLGIALSDLPTRLGRQMVVGRVVQGLDLADEISTRPLAVPEGMRSLDWAPREPVAIRDVRLECRP
jgi:cyclophilin family peptidyl-prolyl cis-trans isomerase